MKLGLILECQPDGPDEKVLRCLLSKFAPHIEPEFVALGNKVNLVRDCGTASRKLAEDGCENIVIVWDLYPAEWGESMKQKDRNPCLHNDRQRIHLALENAGVSQQGVSLVAIEYMLESWLLADEKALAAFLSECTKREITRQQVSGPKPNTAKRPKDALSKIFEQQDYRAYRDFDHAFKIANEITDLRDLKRLCPTFHRFWNKVTGET